jgi:hypothetical protein
MLEATRDESRPSAKVRHQPYGSLTDLYRYTWRDGGVACMHASTDLDMGMDEYGDENMDTYGLHAQFLHPLLEITFTLFIRIRHNSSQFHHKYTNT